MKFKVAILALVVAVIAAGIGFNVHSKVEASPTPHITKDTRTGTFDPQGNKVQMGHTITKDGSIYFGDTSDVGVDSVDQYKGNVLIDFEALPKNVQGKMENEDTQIIREYNTNKTFRDNLDFASKETFYPLTDSQIHQLINVPNGYTQKEYIKHVISEGGNF